MSKSEDEICSELVKLIPSIQENEKILEECARTCINYGKSGEDFFYERESIRFGARSKTSSEKSNEVTMDDIAQIRTAFQRNLLKINSKKSKSSSGTANLKGKSMLQSTYLPKPSASGSQSAAKRMLMHSRSQPSTVSKGFGVDFRGPSDLDKKIFNYRYMYETVTERGAVLDERIEEIGNILKQHYDIVDFGDPNSITEDDIVVIGRICGDSDASTTSPSSKLSEDSIFLESSRSMGSGTFRVALRFNVNLKLRGVTEGSGTFPLFPGAIVALKGKNGGGTTFVVNELLALPCPPNSETRPSHNAFSVAVACGPFTNDSDVDFAPFSSLVEKISTTRPSVVLLQGPFIDVNHPIIRMGELEVSTDYVLERMTKQLSNFLQKSPDSLVLLIPSVRDMSSDHPVFPQRELIIPSLLDQRIQCLSNPCRFSINGISFAATSVDVLFHLRNQELTLRGQEVAPLPCAPGVSNDPITIACRHILQQRSFYPLFPVPHDFSSEVNLDVSHSEGLQLLTDSQSHAPDVLILSSRLKHFSKLVDSTTTVNPSSITKGTYALITVPETPYSSVREAIQCEILKI